VPAVVGVPCCRAYRAGRLTQVAYAYLRRYLVLFDAGRLDEARESCREAGRRGGTSRLIERAVASLDPRAAP
jgi:hypothetical protein